MTSLIDLTKEQERLLQIIEEAHGEMTPEVAEEFDALAHALAGKADSYGRVHHALEARIAEMEGIKAKVEAKLKAYRRDLDSLHERAIHAIPVGEKRKGDLFTLSVRKGRHRVEITDPKLVPDVFFKTPEPEISKKAIAAVLKENEPVPGAKLARGNPYLVVS